jgi:hypothetical protein
MAATTNKTYKGKKKTTPKYAGRKKTYKGKRK